MQVRYRQKWRFWSNSWLWKIAGRAKCQKHLPTTKLSIWHSRPRVPTGYHRLLDVRTTKWQKQLPRVMQCRSHSRRRTIECLFVTACSMDQYAEENRTEKNLIVRSCISEAETSNNKRLRSTFCIEAIQTRSIARPLCNSRASCYNFWHMSSAEIQKSAAGVTSEIPCSELKWRKWRVV